MHVVGDRPIAVFHVGGEFYALDDRCPHAGASLARGYLEGDVVSCRIHHWRFCIRDGKYVDQELPNYDARSYPVRVLDGMIQVDVSNGRS